jgi:hypothetical protein
MAFRERKREFPAIMRTETIEETEIQKKQGCQPQSVVIAPYIATTLKGHMES